MKECEHNWVPVNNGTSQWCTICKEYEAVDFDEIEWSEDIREWCSDI